MGWFTWSFTRIRCSTPTSFRSPVAIDGSPKLSAVWEHGFLSSGPLKDDTEDKARPPSRGGIGTMVYYKQPKHWTPNRCGTEYHVSYDVGSASRHARRALSELLTVNSATLSNCSVRPIQTLPCFHTLEDTPGFSHCSETRRWHIRSWKGREEETNKGHPHTEFWNAILGRSWLRSWIGSQNFSLFQHLTKIGFGLGLEREERYYWD